jgi:hypothetical protein
MQSATAQTKGTRILFLMDASSSMTLNWHDSTTRFQAASRIVLSIIDSISAINNEVEFAVRTYGTEYEAASKNCFDTKLEVPFNLQNVNQIQQKLKYVKPLGSSPIAFSLKEASNNELSNTSNYEYSFILITDGGESCGGNICDAYKNLVQNKVKVLPYIIGLDNNSQLVSYYNCLGQFVSVANPGDIANAVKLIVDNNRVLLEKPKTKNLVTTFSNSKPLEKPNVVEPVIQYVSSDFLSTKAIIAYKPAYENPAFRTRKVGKLVLPKLIFEPEYIPVGLEGLPANVVRALTIKALKKPILSTLKTSKILLPKLEFEPEFIPIGVASLPTAALKPLNGFKLNELRLKNKKATKFLLPTMTFEPEFVATELASLQQNPTKPLATKTLKQPSSKNLKTPKFVLPNMEFEPEFIAINVGDIPSIAIKPFASKALKQPVYKGFNIGKTVMPVMNFEPEIKETPLASLFPSQFRISFPPKSSDSVRPMRLKKRQTKPNEAIANLIARLQKLDKPKTKPSQTPKPLVEEETVFKVESTPSEISQIVVYFTDGNGKFYQSKPMVSIVDAATKEVKQKFMRDVFKNGEPEPVDLKTFGTYDVMVLGQKDLTLKNVVLEKNKINKVIIVVNQGTLQFAYRTNRETPVKFEARITKRWIQAPSYTYMKCDEKKVYDPGEYYVEINTLPAKKLHTEISFGAVTEIQLAQDGNVVFTNMQPIGDVTLYFEDGDNFSDFYTVKVNGGGPSKALYLQPGLYKAEFIAAGMPKQSAPTIVDFKIVTEKTTEVELKNHNGLLITPDGIGNKKVINAPATIKLK